jgi:NAD+ diphosphatase
MRSVRYNLLSGPYIDRVAHWRKDEARIRAALEDPNSVFVPVWRNQNLVRPGTQGITAFMVANVRRTLQIDLGDVVLLGTLQERACFAIPLTTPELPTFDEPVEPRDLRAIAGELPPEEAGLLAYARAMLHWRERNRFCGRCGAVMRSLQAGHVQQCSSPTCAIHVFPRIDPAIIVLVTDGERALLGRQASWPPGRYSTIAGFVEPGESLEDAVAREVLEETGVQIDSADYHSSQPWPFPSSLMLGFVARAQPQAIHLADAELEDARWLTREQIASGEIRMPFQHSISFRLIEDWYNEGASVPLRQEPHLKV